MSQVLSCWKEIAQYVGKGVRTVQRWERTAGLPVRRPMPGCNAVMAYADELDGWLGRSGELSEVEQLRAKVAELTALNEELQRELALSSHAGADDGWRFHIA